MKFTKVIVRALSFAAIFVIAFSNIVPSLNTYIQTVKAQSYQSINTCFVNLDSSGNVISSLPEGSTISINLYTDPGNLAEGQINSYGSTNIPIIQTHLNAVNTDLTGSGINNAYCVINNFVNEVNHEYTYTQAQISSSLDWLQVRYNDEISIDYVDPDIAFPYSGEWFDNIAGNESLRNTNADGHITMSSERQNRTLVIVSQLDQNLPDYEVQFSDALTSENQYTLSTLPETLDPNSTINLRLNVQNMGSLLWLSSLDASAINPVNVSYHWKNLDNDSLSIYNGNRAALNHDLDYTENDSNIDLLVNTPDIPGNYLLIIDLVHEGVTWFSSQGAETKVFNITVGTPEAEAVTPDLEIIPTEFTSAQTLALLTANTYVVQPYSGNPNGHCGGYDCLLGIAEDFYQCSSNGISNYSPNTTDINILKAQCWWPIFEANQVYWQGYIPPVYANTPWNYIEVGWVLTIPDRGGGGTPPPIPPAGNFNGSYGATPNDPYAGMNGAWSVWAQVTFDRWIAWDGSHKGDNIKWSETIRPATPTLTGINTSSDGKSATIYGVAIPKNMPMHIKVWNEFRYCWACKSGWEFFYQQGTAQHVKVVLFKNNWEYIGEVWNDRADGRWQITLPIGTINPGDRIFAEVQIEADYTFSGLHWWSNTTETRNFNLRDPKYTGFPYFGSGGGNNIVVPNITVDSRSNEEKAIDQRASLLSATGGSSLTNTCGYPTKTYSNINSAMTSGGNGPGAIIFVNGRAIYSFGGTHDTFNYYSDKCLRFGIPVDDPHDGGSGKFNTPGAYQDFSTTGRQATGRIYWSFKYVGKFVYGTIWNKFEQAGGTNSSFGWPISETYAKGIQTCQAFEGGEICNDPTRDRIESYCNDYRNGRTTEAGYEKYCGTLLNTGLINLPSVSIVKRNEWGAKYNQESADSSVYNYFIRDEGLALNEILDSIVIHHTTDRQDQDIIDLEQKEINNYLSIPYHFIINDKGQIFEGRPLEFLGDHVFEQNHGKIGIALMGDFESRWQNLYMPDSPTEAQLNSLEKLVDDLQDTFGVNSNNILGHRFVQGQIGECPGDNLEPFIPELRIYADNN